MSFSAISPARAVDEIASQVRSMIADGRLRPGDRLPAERELSARLQVSRNTLREALRTLEHAGLIEMRKGASGGPFVRPGSAGVIVNGLSDLYHLGAISPQQLTEARIWLSDLVVRAACERANDEDLRALDANIEAGVQANDAGRFDERQRLNREFHIILARSTRNTIVAITMESVMGVFGQFIEKIGPSENPYTLPSRRRFMKLLRARDSEAAVAEMSKHLRRLHDHYLARWTEMAAAA
ncbi:FadR/GntR family transcriptional regulator [Variovorax sp. J31P207]|uniref:FadR/GntR family transcriptional regulator n=1 Tax=Variovorax sp. J31P207 TaxID=3053510 RepID=UPI0025759233|nr:FadR/GntR family transcriptional regulator [Variovorax sp. J31P207]MDM0066851.1 FadR/GntR family transcriptional regulator [Variovorax sp. J31P207]